MRIITIVGLLSSLFVALTAYAVDLDGQSRTYLHSRETINDDNLLPLFEYLDFRIDEFAIPELSFHLGGWIRQDLTRDQSFDQRSFNGDLQYAYLGYHLKQANARMNLGRVLVYDGVASELVDGISLRSDLRGGFGFSAYGGSPAETDYDDRDGDSIFGGRLSHELPGWYRIGLSYLKEKNDGNDFRSEEGVDVRLFPGKRLEVYGRSTYNEETSDWAEHSYYATFKAFDRLRFSSEIVYTSYADYFQAVDDFTTSVFLFAPGILDPREELLLTGGQVQADLTENLSVTADYKYYDYDIADNADYYGGRIVYRQPDSWGAGLSVYRMDGDTDRLKYLEARLYGYKKFADADITVDLFNVNYDEPRDNNEDNAFSASAAFGYNLTENARVAMDVEYAKNPTYDYDYRGFFKFIYDFTIAPLFVAKEGKEAAITAQAAVAPVHPDEEARLVEKGKGVFEKICNTCHRFDRKVIGPPLNSVLPGYQGKPEELMAFIANPTKKNPDYPAMPNPGLKEDELQAVATYLLSTVKAVAPAPPVEVEPLAPESRAIPEAVTIAPPPALLETDPGAFDPWSESIEEWKHRIANTPTDKYTIQVEISKRRNSILKDLQELLANYDAMVIPYRVQSYDAYTLVVGIYDSRAEGNAAIKELPERFQRLGPLVKTMPTIQKGLTPLGVAPLTGEVGPVSQPVRKPTVSPAKKAAPASPDDQAVLIAEGKKIFNEVCTTCHRFDSKLVGPPLMTVLPNYEDRIDELKAFIQNPTKKNPEYPAMMNLGLGKEKVLAVATYLVSTLPTAKAPKTQAPAKTAKEVPPAPKIERKVETAVSSPAVIVIDRIQKKMAPVTFQHAEHQKRTNNDCTVCHHMAEPGEMKPAPCSECHGNEDGALGFKAVMHKTCQDCHKKMAAEGLQPPTTCMGCHPK